ncbi:hypothetical protein WDB86_03360 [Thioclava sp. GXIMD4215]
MPKQNVGDDLALSVLRYGSVEAPQTQDFRFAHDMGRQKVSKAQEVGRPIMRRQGVGIGPAFDEHKAAADFPILMERVFKASGLVSARFDGRL